MVRANACYTSISLFHGYISGALARTDVGDGEPDGDKIPK
jgi:hypothetical protein